MNGNAYIFSGGDDKTVKAWSFDMQTGYLKLDAGRPFDYPITSLCFVKPLGVVIIGLSNGSFYGWNPTSNDADIMTAHAWPITSMSINGQWLFSGD